MRYKQSRKVFKLLGIIGLLIILLLTLSKLIKKRKAGLWNRIVIKFSKYRSLEKYIIAQARFETADFTSKVYNTDYNMFGMKGATKRKQLGEPGLVASDGGRYQHYKNDTQSLRDLFLYFDYVKFPITVGGTEQYSSELKTRGYYTADQQTYTNGLNQYVS